MQIREGAALIIVLIQGEICLQLHKLSLVLVCKCDEYYYSEIWVHRLIQNEQVGVSKPLADNIYGNNQTFWE